MVEGSGWLNHHTKDVDRAEMKHFVELKLTYITQLSKTGNCTIVNVRTAFLHIT